MNHHKGMRKIEHIGIAVRDLKESSVLFEKLLGTPAYKTEEVTSEGVRTAFFQSGPNKVELLDESYCPFFGKKRGGDSPCRF